MKTTQPKHMNSEENNTIRNIPLFKLLNFCDPFRDQPWKNKVSQKMVEKAIKESRFCDSPVPPDTSSKTHAERIAWLATNGWNDAIEVDVGVPVAGHYISWMVQDGNHRLAAAIIRGDNTILAEIGGQLSLRTNCLAPT